MDKLLTVKEVAGFLRVQQSTVYELVRKGRLHGIHVSRTVLRIRQSDLDAFVGSASEAEKPKAKPVLRQRPPLLALREVADRLKVTTKALLQWINEGRLPATRLGHYYYIYEDDLRQIEQQRQPRPIEEAEIALVKNSLV
jgi:excisionase family DNA binding protein